MLLGVGMAGSAYAQGGGGWQGEIKSPPPTPTPAAQASATPKAEPTPEKLLLPPKTEPEERLAVFFKHLKAGDVDVAYRVLLEGSKIGSSERDVTMLKTKTREAIGLVGTIAGFDKLEVKPAGDHFRRYTYLALGKEFPLRWRFYFYQSDDVWRLIDIRISDRLTELFGEEASPDDPSVGE